MARTKLPQPQPAQDETKPRDPAECGICGKVLARKGDMPRHLRVHEKNEKDLFSCPYTGCDYRTLQKGNVKTHIRTHTKDKNQLCPDCDYRTCDPGSLTRHRKRRHEYVPKPRKARGTARAPSPPSSQASTSSQASEPQGAETEGTTSCYTRSASESSSSSDSSSSSYTPPYYPYYGANSTIPGSTNTDPSVLTPPVPPTTLPAAMDYAPVRAEHSCAATNPAQPLPYLDALMGSRLDSEAQWERASSDGLRFLYPAVQRTPPSDRDVDMDGRV